MKTITIIPLLALATTAIHAADTPDFVIIYADDLGYTQTSVPMMKDRPELTHKTHQTPNLEKLAQRGMRFSNAYCSSPVCTSSRASIQHGKTTARVGCISLHDVVMNKKKIDLGKNLSIAEMFKEADKDYVTAFFGKGCSPIRQLNTGEIKLFNVDRDMSESNNLSKTLPEKPSDMVRRLDAYLEKVGAWTMEEVYATRTEELEKWVDDGKEKVAKINGQLKANNLDERDRKKIQAELKLAQSRQIKHRSNLEKLNQNRKSTRRF